MTIAAEIQRVVPKYDETIAATTLLQQWKIITTYDFFVLLRNVLEFILKSTIKPDFLNLEAPNNQVKPEVDGAETEEFDSWIDTIRRRRTRRQSRFC